MLKRFKNWLIKLLGGYTANEYKAMKILCERREEENGALTAQIKALNEHGATIFGEYCKTEAAKKRLEKSLVTAEAEIPLGGAMRYTENNVINESRNQTYYLLGKAVYPYAKHFVTTNKYICTINVQGKVE